MTYNVLMDTLNPTHSVTHSPTHSHRPTVRVGVINCREYCGELKEWQ